MAILKNGINGGFSGKAGTVIGYELNGQQIIKGYKKRKKRKPGKMEQANRDKFALTQKWLQPLLDVLRIGFNNYAPTYKGFVAAKSYNSKNALKQLEDGTWFVDPALALVSFGQLALPPTIAMELIGNEIVLTWDRKLHDEATDQAMVLAYLPKTGKAYYDTAAAKRQTKKAVLEVPNNILQEEIHVYIAFFAFDHSIQSNSHYLGKIDLGNQPLPLS